MSDAFGLLLPVRLAWGERLFVLWAGLKGAVPILLGTFLLTAGVPDATRLYAVIVVVAAGSLADGSRTGDLDVGEDFWISIVIRDDQLVPVSGSAILRAGDEILALTDPERGPDLAPIFTPKPGTGHAGPAPA
jgi:potassium/hydrogen antiporter